MKDSGQDIEFDIGRGMWVARGCLDRRIAEEEKMVEVVIETLNNKFSRTMN